MSEREIRVGLVGHCGFDSSGLTKAVKSAMGDSAKIVSIKSDEAIKEESCDLLLVNRVLDGRFSAADGIGLIKEHADSGRSGRAMLISNFEDAQAAAVEAGGVLGFGKREMKSEATLDRIREGCAASA